MLVQIITENGQKKIIPLTADAGAGNPVGTIIPMYKKSSPSGYLYCDGSTFDETQYPLLYAYLGSNVLPDYREFALVGAEENTTDVYNASTNPNGTIHDHDVYTEGQAKDDQFQKHEHKVLSNQGSAGGAGGGVQASSTPGNFWTQEVNGTGQRSGTVTRGKRKAVYFYIKATSGLTEGQQDDVANIINGERSYSTDEINTGKKWIDGKPIYRKVVDCGALPNSTTKYVVHNITNIEYIVSITGAAKDKNIYIPLPLVSKANKASDIGIFITSTDIAIEAGGDRSSFTESYVTLEYTKTT